MDKERPRRRRRRAHHRPTSYIVIPDTSVLWCEDKTLVVNPEFEKFWADNAIVFRFELMIPAVVRGELLFQQCSSARKHLDKARSMLEHVSAIADVQLGLSVNPEDLKNQIACKLDRWMEHKGGRILPLPSAVDLNRLAEAAIWREPPFAPDAKDSESEKGFRDALILETVCDFVTRETRRVSIAFLCADGLLTQAARSRLDAHGSCAIHASLAEFDSFLKLNKESHEKAYAASLLERAKVKFFSPGDETAVWFRENLEKRIRTMHEAQFKANNNSVEMWVPLDQGQWRISNPEFVSRDGGSSFKWRSPVAFLQLYKLKAENAGLGTKAGDSVGSYLVDALHKLAVAWGSKMRELLLVQFSVDWTMKLSNDGRVLDCQVDSVAFGKRDFSSLTPEMQERYHLADS